MGIQIANLTWKLQWNMYAWLEVDFLKKKNKKRMSEI